jgi:hypothetical protein
MRMGNWLDLYTPGDSALLILARGYRDAAALSAAAAHEDAESINGDVAASAANADAAAGSASTATTQAGIATSAANTATTQAGIATSAANTATTQAALADADRIAAQSSAGAAAADRVQTGLDRNAAAGSAAAAAASVSATANRTVGRRLSDTAIWPTLCATPRSTFGPTGLLEAVPVDTLGFRYDPALGVNLGVLFNPARSPLNANPLTPGGTGWSGLNVGLAGAPVAVAGPDGTSSAWRITEDTNTSAHVIGQATTYALNGLLTTNALVYAGSATAVQISGGGTAFSGSTRRCSFHLSGAGSVFDAGSSTLASRITHLGGGLYWIWCVWATPATVVSSIVYLSLLPDTSTFGIRPSYLGAGRHVDVVAMWSETGPYGSFAWATRAQPTTSIPVAQLGSDFSARQGALLVDWASIPGAFQIAGVTDADWLGIVSWGDGTANERMGLVINPAHNVIEARLTVGGVAQPPSSVSITPPSPGATSRALLTWDLGAGLMQVSAGGVAGSKVALPAVPRSGLIMPGRFGTSHPLAGAVSGIQPRPAALFDGAGAPLTA